MDDKETTEYSPGDWLIAGAVGLIFFLCLNALAENLVWAALFILFLVVCVCAFRLLVEILVYVLHK